MPSPDIELDAVDEVWVRDVLLDTGVLLLRRQLQSTINNPEKLCKILNYLQHICEMNLKKNYSKNIFFEYIIFFIL